MSPKLKNRFQYARWNSNVFRFRLKEWVSDISCWSDSGTCRLSHATAWCQWRCQGRGMHRWRCTTKI